MQRVSFIVWRIFRDLKFDADMIYSRDHAILADMVNHLIAMTNRIVPPKLPETFAKYDVDHKRSVTAEAADLEGYVSVLFRMAARLMIITKYVDTHIAGQRKAWADLEEKDKIRVLAKQLDNVAMKQGTKVEERKQRPREW